MQNRWSVKWGFWGLLLAVEPQMQKLRRFSKEQLSQELYGQGTTEREREWEQREKEDEDGEGGVL